VSAPSSGEKPVASSSEKPAATHLASPEQRGDLAERGEIQVEGEAHRHLFRSRRLAVGALLRVVDGRGLARLGRVASIDKRSASVELGERAASNELGVGLGLWVGALDPGRASWLVEKATELGAGSIRFVATERTPRSYGDGRLDRLRRVAVAAVEQSHRSVLPTIEGVLPWSALEAGLADADGVFVLQPGSPSLVDACRGLELRGYEPRGRIDILIGPEGGWSSMELEQLSELGARAAGLGPGVLRVETAALAALAILVAADSSSRRGDRAEMPPSP
jgi:16S rRNA (uracil1498-N3)-methyltransferase